MKPSIHPAAPITRNAIMAGACFLAICIAVPACRKNTASSSDTHFLRTAVSSWYGQLAKTASKDNRSAANDILPQLDYADGAVVEQTGTRKIYLVRKRTPASHLEYLALLESGNTFQATGIYIVSSLQQLQQYLRTNQLPAGEKIGINALTGQPLVRRETRADGKPLLAMVQNRKAAEQTIRQNKIRGTNATRKLNSYAPDGECIDYYWITYDLETGEIYDIEYAFTSCITNGGSGGSGGNGAMSGEEVACQQQGESEIDASDQTSPALSTSTATSGLVRTRSYHWEICNGLTWRITSHETGTHQYSNADNQWHWVSLTHNTVSVSGYWLMGTISCTVNSAVSNVYDQYAGMELFFTVNFAWSCGRFTVGGNRNMNRALLIEVNRTI